ncbi:MAG: DsbA family oxidoreductase [Tepidiformaceae bacterium]
MTAADLEETEAPAGPLSLIVVSDFVCPWCYIGLMEVERLRAEYDVEVRFAPYLLDPSTPPQGKPRKPYTNPGDPPTPMEERATGLGLTFARGRTFTSNSLLAHEAAEFTAEHGGDVVAFHRRMFHAYFEELEDVGNIDVIVAAGADVGLDADELRAALVARRYRQEVQDGLNWAREIGVTAVPTFVFDDKYGFPGAQDYETFVSVVRRLGYRPKA